MDKTSKNILIFGDGESVLIQKRVAILRKLPQNKIFIHNSTGKKLTQKTKEYLDGFRIIEQPRIASRTARYIFSCVFTLLLILRFRPSLIVVHWASRLYQNMALKMFADRLFVTVMGGEIMADQEGRHPQKRPFTQMLLSKAGHMTTESSYMKKILIDDFVVQPDRILVCNFGVEPSFYNPRFNDSLYDLLSIKRGVKIFFSMRAMEPFYQTDVIVRSFIEFKKQTASDAVLLVTANRSSAEYLGSIREFACASDAGDDIKIIDDIPHEQLSGYVALCDAVISMAPSDGLPHTMLECLAAKKFMIFRDLPQYDGFLEHKKNAFLVQGGDELVEAFEYVVTRANLGYELDEKVAELIDKEILTSRYLAVCSEIMDKETTL